MREVSLLYNLNKPKGLFRGFSVLDTLVIHVPLCREFYTVRGNLANIKGDVADFQIEARPSYYKRDFQGNVTVGDLYHPFESLPTSFSGMGTKFYATNVANTAPYIALNASTKILQGHNVYGGESVFILASEMLSLLRSVYPAFYATLDVANARISSIDFTFSARLPSANLVQPCLRYLNNVGVGHRKADDRRDFYNTVYFGGQTSRYGGAKVYGKGYELKNEINKLTKKAKGGCTLSAKKLVILDAKLLGYAESLLRFESTTRARQLERLGYPTNLWAFINYQLTEDRQVGAKLWRQWFDPIFGTLKGDIMPDATDSDILDKLKETYFSYNKKGEKTYRKAFNAYNFYKLLRLDGWEAVKGRYNPRTFQDNVKALVDSGFSRSYLQNLALDTQKVLPIVELIQLDFLEQCPSGYVPPSSDATKDFAKFVYGAKISTSKKFDKLYDLDGKLLPQPSKRH